MLNFLKTNLKFTIATSIIFIIAVFMINSHYYRITYAFDLLRSAYIEHTGIADNFSRQFTVVEPGNFDSYEITTRSLPKGFSSAGPFLVYEAAESTRLRDVAEMIIYLTDSYTLRELSHKIKKLNNVSAQEIKKGQVILIPGKLPAMLPGIKKNKNIQLSFARGLYFTGSTTGSKNFIESLPVIRKSGINAVVFDAKDITGIINYKSDVELVKKYGMDRKRTIDNPSRLLRELHKNGFYTIARIAVFRDHLLVKNNPSFAIHSKRTGGVWNRGSKEIWCDPTNKDVQNYNIALAKELCRMGADEIQFDYIRFPTAGDLSDAVFRNDAGKFSKEVNISMFLKQAYSEISKLNTFLSIDIYGVVAWGKDIDIRRTGQKIEMLAKHCDVISPMLYPSHFNDGFDNFSNPGDHPYYFIKTGCEKLLEKAENKTIVRPWLQAFGWRVSNYNENYIHEQIRASNDSGAFGYLFWNASNSYGTVLKAMSAFKQNRQQKNKDVKISVK